MLHLLIKNEKIWIDGCETYEGLDVEALGGHDARDVLI